MNIAVINLKDLIKYALCFFAILTIVALGIKNFIGKEEFEIADNENHEDIIGKIENSSFLCFLKMELPLIMVKDEKKETKEEIEISSEKILNSQIAILYNLEDDTEIDNMELEDKEELQEIDNVGNEEIAVVEENKEESNKEEIPENVKTEVINDNNIKATFTNEGSNVKVNNQTSYDIKDLLENADYEITNKEKFVIYHTHTCESYTSSDSYKYEMTGAYRTTDLNYTVARVGDELEKYLTEYGKTVIHDKTYHDYPSYNGSYGRSLKTLEKILESNDDTEIAIDLHRDAIGSNNNYAPTVKIGDEMCAQVMFVIGTDGSRIRTSKLEEKFAICN